MMRILFLFFTVLFSLRAVSGPWALLYSQSICWSPRTASEESLSYVRMITGSGYVFLPELRECTAILCASDAIRSALPICQYTQVCRRIPLPGVLSAYPAQHFLNERQEKQLDGVLMLCHLSYTQRTGLGIYYKEASK